MRFTDTIERYINVAASSSRQQDADVDHIDLLLPLEESWSRDAVAFRTASSAPFGTWWSGSTRG